MLLDVHQALVSTKIDSVTVRILLDFGKRFERLIKSDRIRNLTPLIRSEFESIANVAPKTVQYLLRLACAEIISSKLNNAYVALESCYKPVLDELDSKPSENELLKIRAQAVIGYTSCFIQSSARSDTCLCCSDIISIVECCAMLQSTIQNICSETALLSLVYNAASITRICCAILVNAGRGLQALPFISYIILILERFFSLRKHLFYQFYLQLYDLVVTISLQIGTDQLGSTALERLNRQIIDLKLDPIVGNTSPIKSWIAVRSLRLKLISSGMKIEDLIDNKATATQRLSVIAETVCIHPLGGQKHRDNILKALALSPTIIKEVLQPAQTIQQELCSQIYQILFEAVRHGQLEVSQTIIELCQGVDSSLQSPIMHTARLCVLIGQADLQQSSWRNEMRDCISKLKSFLATEHQMPINDLLENQLAALYEYNWQSLYRSELDYGERSDTEKVVLDIADFGVYIRYHDPSSYIRYLIVLTQYMPATEAILTLLENGLTITKSWRSRLNEQSYCSKKESSVHDDDSHPEEISTSKSACLHAELLQSLYRVLIQTQPWSQAASIRDQIEADYSAQAVFWIQAAQSKRSLIDVRKIESRLSRAEALLQQADENLFTQTIVNGPVVVWAGTNRVALQAEGAWRLYGRLADSNALVSTSDIGYIGLGVDLSPSGPYVVSGLDPDSQYQFGYKTGPKSPMFASSRPVSTCLQLPLPLIWSYLSRASFKLKCPRLAFRAARRAVAFLEIPTQTSDFPIQNNGREFLVLDEKELLAAPKPLIESAALCYEILSETMQLPASLTRPSIHIRSLKHSEGFLIRKAHWLQLFLHCSTAIGHRRFVFRAALRLWMTLAPIADQSVVFGFLVACLQALFHVGIETWTKPISAVAIRIAAALIRLLDNAGQSSLAITPSELAQLLSLDCSERDCLRALLSRSSSSVLRDAVPKGSLHLLSGSDLTPLHNQADLPVTTRALLCLEAMQRLQFDDAIKYLPAAISSNTGAASALCQYVECVSLWFTSQSAPDANSDTRMVPVSVSDTSLRHTPSWDLHRYRYLNSHDVQLPQPIDLGQISSPMSNNLHHHLSQPGLTVLLKDTHFWSRLVSAMEVAYEAKAWCLLHACLRFLRHVIWTSTSSPAQLAPLYPTLIAMADIAFKMIDHVRHAGPLPVDPDGISREPALHLSWGLRYSNGHDLVSQSEWRTSLWFMPVSLLDLDLIQDIAFAVLSTLFQVRQWSRLVQLGRRFVSLTQSNGARAYLNVVLFAQQQLTDTARVQYQADEQALAVLDRDMEQTRAESLRRKAQKRSRLSKQEEEEKLATAVAQYEARRKDILDRISKSKAELNKEVQSGADFTSLKEEVCLDYPISCRKLDQARQLYASAITMGNADMTGVIAAYQSAIEISKSKQETIIMSRALLELADIHCHVQQHQHARQIWTTLIELLAARTKEDVQNPDSTLSRLGLWNCLYAAIGHYRLITSNDVTSNSNSALICSRLAHAVLAMSLRHPSEAVRLVPTYSRPEPVILGLDLTQHFERVKFSDLYDAFMFSTHQCIADDHAVDGLAPLVLALDVCRYNASLCIEALSLKVQVCVAIGQITEALSLVQRLLRLKPPYTIVSNVALSTTASKSIVWRNDLPLSSNEECIRSLLKEDLPTSAPDPVRQALGCLLGYWASLGRHDCFDAAKSLLDRNPVDIARLYMQRGLISECLQECDQILERQDGRQWVRASLLQLEAILIDPLHRHLHQFDSIANALLEHARHCHDIDLDLQVRLLKVESDLLSGLSLDTGIDLYRPILNREHRPYNRVFYAESVLTFASLLMQRQDRGDISEAISQLEALLDGYQLECHQQGIHLSLNRYLPALRHLVLVHIALSEAHQHNSDHIRSERAAAAASRYLDQLPYQDSYLDAIVRYRQVQSGSSVQPDLALACANTIINGCGHELRLLRRALISLSHQFTDRDRIAYVLQTAVNVTESGRRLQHNMFELGATPTPVDKLDSTTQRDLRDLSLALAIQSRSQLTPTKEITAQTVDSIKKELPKITTLDLLQLFVALRQDEEWSWRENRLRRRYLQTLHIFLRDNLPAYRNTCCINKIELDSLKTSPISATSLIFAWQRCSDRGHVQLTFICGSATGILHADCTIVAQIYLQAGLYRLLETARAVTPDIKFSELCNLIYKAFADSAGMTNSTNDKPQISIQTIADIQQLFDVDGVQMVNNAALVTLFEPILRRSTTTMFS